MRNILQITVLLMCFLCFLPGEKAVAAPVTPEQAETVVKGWVFASNVRLGTEMGGSIEGMEIFEDRSGPLFFVVYLKPSGFVIVPADDRLEPITGFSDGLFFDASPSNPLGALVLSDMRGRFGLLARLQKTAMSADTETLDSFADNRRKWRNLTQIGEQGVMLKSITPSDLRVGALVQTEWDQEGVGTNLCYNYYTPFHYPAGCGAIAMAQVMRYFEYPTNAVGTNSYSVMVDGAVATLPMRGRDGTGAAYFWYDMPYVPEESTIEKERKAIGSLCYDAGLAIASKYTELITLSSPDILSKAFTNTFFYGNSVFGFNTNSNIGDGLVDMINPNLDAGNPVVLAVLEESSGHAVVCDGYGYDDGTLYHHVNMGWSGAYDAWYNLPSVDEYTSVFGCVYNVFKTGTGEIISGRVFDNSGSALSDVMVSAESLDSGFFTNTLSNSRGIYALRNLPSGETFTITASNEVHLWESLVVSTGVSSNYAKISGNLWGIDLTAGSTNPPLPPSGLTASRDGYTDKIRVAWSFSGGALAYEVWRSESPESNTAEKVSTSLIDSLFYDDTSCEKGLLYYYWVTAVNNIGASGFSESAYGWSALPSPTGVSATDGVYTGKIAVTWSAVTHAQSYEVWRGNRSEVELAVKTASVTETGYEDRGVSEGATYYYRIKSVNTNSVSGFSDVASGSVLADSTPELFSIYRLYSYGAQESTYEHLWTINVTEKDLLASYPSWIYEGVAWRAFKTRANGSTPLYRLYAPSVRQHHYTINVGEYIYLSDSDPAWNGEGIQYYVMAEEGEGALPVYRFYHKGLYLHHFTIDESEKNAIEAHPEWGYEYEGIGFYVFAVED